MIAFVMYESKVEHNGFSREKILRNCICYRCNDVTAVCFAGIFASLGRGKMR
uniref:Uncharacterized protein n=1 Tax=Uncultured archaeon GZfos26G2 TaxID=3386331 RepID=Q648J9_UNCAG|nr:hypothetical protein GZ37D1_25 [uncultured archaeon GZfos37D1]